MILVSIVVPVYNVEKYFKRCVDSLVNQTLQNIEIILVDDGSLDNSGMLCDEFARNDSRIIVIHKKNGGLSSARNVGLKIAKGKYIGFVDSDDDVELDMYERMSEKLESTNADFVMADYIRVLNNGSSYLKTTNIEGGLYNSEDIRRVIFPQLIMNEALCYGPLLSVWHCLYSTSFLRENQIWFDEEVRWSEDNIFSAFVGYRANRFFYMKNVGLYHYYENLGTITTGYRKGAWQVYSIMNAHLQDFFEKVDIYDFSFQLKLHAIFYACNSCRQVPKSGENFTNQYKLIREILNSELLKEVFVNFKCPESWPMKLKFQIWAMKCRLSVLCLLMVK